MIVKERGKLVVFLMGVIISAGAAFAVDTTAIDAVLEKVKADNASFSSADATEIDAFLESALGEMLTAKNFWEAIDLRGTILERQGDQSMGRYREEFISSARRHLQFAIEEVLRSEQNEEQMRKARALIVLVSLLQDASLADFGISLLDHPDSTVRYWAVKSITNPKIAAQLKSVTPDAVQLLGKIAAGLESVIENEQYPEVLGLIVSFARDIKGSQGKKLILKVADKRIKAYADWSVRYELMDTEVLAVIGEMILLENPDQDRIELCRRFGQLYSYVIQRYILGKDVLKDAQLEQLASVMIEVEQAVVSRLLGVPHENMKKYIERKSMVALKSEHKSLLGDSSTAGELSTKFNFDYGKDSNNKPLTAPLEMKEPPAKPAGVVLTEEEEEQ